jgi:hypothetical protein
MYASEFRGRFPNSRAFRLRRMLLCASHWFKLPVLQCRTLMEDMTLATLEVRALLFILIHPGLN